MLNVWLNDIVELNNIQNIADVKSYFAFHFKTEWMQSDLAKEIVLGVDKTKYVSGHYFESPVYGGIAPYELSTGCKALLILLNTNETVCGDRMGDNCYPYVFRIAEQKDITITLQHDIYFEYPFRLKVLNTGRVVDNMKDFMDEYLNSWIVGVEEDEI